MDALAERRHAGRESFRIGAHVAVLIAAEQLPAVVDVDVIVAQIGEARRAQRLCGAENDGLVDSAVEMVPAHAAQRRDGAVSHLFQPMTGIWPSPLR